MQSIYPFGKWKGVKVSQMLDDNDDSEFSLFGRGDGLSYLQWVKRKCSNIILSEDILKAMKKLEHERSKNYKPSKSYIDMNNWANYDDRQLSISVQDMGYDGDGF